MQVHNTYVPASVLAVLALGAPANGAVFAHADSVIAGYVERQTAALESAQVIRAAADAEKRELTEDEQKQVNGLLDECEELDKQIATRQRIAARGEALLSPQARQVEPDDIEGDEPAAAPVARPAAHAPRPPARGNVPTAPRVVARGTGGFRNLGEFALTVRAAAIQRGMQPDPRLMAATLSTYGSEGVGADGGFSVPPDFRSEIMTKVFGEESLISLTDRMQSASNSISMPIDMTTPWQTTGGIQSYWVGEAATKTQSKPALEEVNMKLHTLATLVPVTEELLEDAPAMDSYLRKKVPEKMDFKISDAIVRGTGVGQPLGFLNSPALVTVSAEGGQTADTINVTNLAKMWGRLPIQSRRSAVWLMHPDAEAVLPLMSLANQPVYMPAGGVSDAAYGRLWGRPVIAHQVAKTIGDVGDVMLVDLNQYLTVTKSGSGRDANGMRADVSIHLWFDQDVVAYRFTIRVAGQPWWSAATAQRDGSNTQSPFIVLAAR